jgi:hypothetical protein
MMWVRTVLLLTALVAGATAIAEDCSVAGACMSQVNPEIAAKWSLSDQLSQVEVPQCDNYAPDATAGVADSGDAQDATATE